MKKYFFPARQLSTLFSLSKSLLIISVCFLASVLKTNAQDSTESAQLNDLLKNYYTIKDALVEDKSAEAASAAKAFVKRVNSVSHRLISEGNVSALRKDAFSIAGTDNITAQRKAFSNFSENIAALAGKFKLSDQPVYLQYCPMANASWLSREKEIRNPYYGSAMLNCGEVKKTFK